MVEEAKIVCAWCVKDGFAGVMKEGTPGAPVTHTVCANHLLRMLEQEQERIKQA